MSQAPRILALAGSARRESLNRKLLAVAVQEVRAAGGDVTLVDLNEYPLPLYHGDLEDRDGLPPNAQRLVRLLTEHRGLLIASPEYNSLITPLLKNTIDWCTRAEPNPLAGRIAAVISASPGAYGGVRSAQLARQLLLHLGCHIVPAQCSLPRADEAFEADGTLRDQRALAAARKVAVELVNTCVRLAG